ncbi:MULTISPECIES: flagellar hook-length control protein FliK [unclassified Pseudoalteromonas]|uniref:flagellar hook-length control protein FliK n=1 Tax=unclassified Pseudoalteromonas TaxID=194690 RepID=UPI0015FF7EB6|nr:MULTISPECIES: flagellar hook-length control protein FliK [unclassified Pseudoalteromonas]MBB1332968.1 flagellar hook-length control protein FliK [Pseudoalteromonas sp. SR41-6]MBB1458211.1 flagellar hook-length control protein FliK [Pseudoalteromonas sp. SG41-8]
MAISDLSVFISTEQDVQLNKKDSAKAAGAADKESTDSDFFSQLQSANNAAETSIKVNSTGAEPRSAEAVIVAEKAQETSVDNSDENAMSGDAMLAQITAANNMDTRVNNTPTVENSSLLSKLGKYSEEKIDPKLVKVTGARPIDDVTPIIDTETPATDDPIAQLVDKQLKPSLLTEKTLLAEAIDKQLQLKGNTPPDDAVTPIIDDIQVAKETSQNKAMAMQPTIQQAVATTTALKSGQVDNDAAQIIAAANTSQGKPQDSEVLAKGSDAMLAQQGKPQQSAALTADAAVTNVTANAKQAIKSATEVAMDAEAVKGVASSSQTDVSEKAAEQSKRNNSAVLEQISKVLLNSTTTVQKNENPLLASLTPEQQKQLQTQVDVIRQQDPSPANITDLKKMLAEFVALNSKEAAKPTTAVATINTAELTQLSKDISLLSPMQKQALSQQLRNFVSIEQPKGALLTQINKAITELAQPESTEKRTESKAQLTVQSMADNLASTTTTNSSTAKSDTNKVSAPQDALIKAASKEQEVKLAVQDNVLKSEQFAENIKAEQSPVRDNTLARVNQLFGQLTGLTTAVTTATAVEGSEQSYQQALADMQVMHAQQASPTSQTRQINIDPTALQALNIMKSDAAKLLQERVSALLSINNKEAEIRLDPPEMGSMQIRIRSDAEQAHINFVVQNQQAKEALEQSMPRLREMLAQQGIELGESSIQQGNSQSDTGGDGQQNGRGQQANQQQNEEETALTQQPIRGSGQQSSSSIDYYA